jgi:hypothetical protein
MGLARANINVFWFDPYRFRSDQRGIISRDVSPRISVGGSSALRREYRYVGRQEIGVAVAKNLHEKVRDWAYKNAYLLIFLSLMFVLTWIVEVWSKYA